MAVYFVLMGTKTFAILTDIHSNLAALEQGISIIKERKDVDQLICLGDCFALGPAPKETLSTLKGLDNCIFIRGNHDRYLIEKLWEQEQPSLEGMDPYDPICQSIVANEEWTAEQLGQEGVDFALEMHVAHREIIGNILIEFTHAWYQRDDQPPSMPEIMSWRDHVKNSYPDIEKFIFVHGHIHTPRHETEEDLTIYCQGATGLPFDETPKGAVAFLTIGSSVEWDVIRYDYDLEATVKLLEERQPPFYSNLQNTVRYASINNDI